MVALAASGQSSTHSIEGGGDGGAIAAPHDVDVLDRNAVNPVTSRSDAVSPIVANKTKQMTPPLTAQSCARPQQTLRLLSLLYVCLSRRDRPLRSAFLPQCDDLRDDLPSCSRSSTISSKSISSTSVVEIRCAFAVRPIGVQDRSTLHAQQKWERSMCCGFYCVHTVSRPTSHVQYPWRSFYSYVSALYITFRL